MRMPNGWPAPTSPPPLAYPRRDSMPGDTPPTTGRFFSALSGRLVLSTAGRKFRHVVLLADFANCALRRTEALDKPAASRHKRGRMCLSPYVRAGEVQPQRARSGNRCVGRDVVGVDHVAGAARRMGRSMTRTERWRGSTTTARA